VYLAVLLLSLVFQTSPQDPQRKKPDVEAQVTGCFGVNEVVGVGANTYILDAKNNTKEDLTLVVHLDGASSVSRTLALPRLSRQRFFITMPVPPGSTAGYARWYLTDDRGRVIGPRDNSVDASLIGDPSRGTKILALADEAMGGGAFDFPTRHLGDRVDTADCRPRNMPDTWIGLRGFNLIVIYNYPLGELSPAQQKAIVDWVAAGGRLVVVPTLDPAYLQSELIKQLFPFDVGPPEFIKTHKDLAGPLAHALPTPQPFVHYPMAAAAPRLEIATRPAWVDHGRGRAFLLPFDLMRPPFAAERDFKTGVWKEIIASESPSALRKMELRATEIPGVTKLVVPPPPIWSVILILAAFVVLVGPANYAYLFGRGRPLLSVVTIPAISLLFALAIIAVGLVFRAGQQAANNVVLLEARSGQTHAFETRLLTLFSTSHASYDFEFQRGTFLLPAGIADPDGGMAWGRDREPIRLEQIESGFAVRKLGLARFEGTVFQGDAVRDLGGSVRFTLTPGDLSVWNETESRFLRGVYVSPQGTACVLGRLEPGGRAQVSKRAGFGMDAAAEVLAAGDPVTREIAAAVLRNRPEPSLFLILEADPGRVLIDGSAERGIRTLVLLRVTP